MPPRDASARDLRFLPPYIAVAPERLTAAAERILAGKYTFFDLDGLRARRSAAMESRSADAARRRRRAAPAAIDYRDERVVGNIKYLWEPNRHLHLLMLAQAHALTGDARYALAIRAQIDSWIEQCPVGRGPNWVSALELGIRLINWSITWQLLGGSRARLFADEDGAAFRERWLDSIYEQARMIAGNLSRFSSANNHLIGEAAGVYVAASTWPLWPQMREWGERCRAILEEECHRQNAPDGGNREQAFGYQTLRDRLPAARGAGGARTRRGFLAGVLAPPRGHDRFPRLDDQRRGRIADDR